MRIYRQGDVLLQEIEKLPSGLEVKDRVLAYGETTGHKHQFRSEQVLVYKDKGGEQYVHVPQKTILSHEEHAQVELPKGDYMVVIQREFDVVSGIRRVMD